MAVTIIIEDGTNVTDSNSYVSIADARTYAANRGVTLPADNDETATLLIKATDYLETIKYQGSKTDVDQSLQWPRKGVYLECSDTEYTNDAIPKNLKLAQYQLIIAANNGIDLLPTIQAGDYVTSEKIGPIETKYADPVLVGLEPTFTAVDSLLDQLINQCGQNTFAIRTIRV